MSETKPDVFDIESVMVISPLQAMVKGMYKGDYVVAKFIADGTRFLKDPSDSAHLLQSDDGSATGVLGLGAIIGPYAGRIKPNDQLAFTGKGWKKLGKS